VKHTSVDPRVVPKVLRGYLIYDWLSELRRVLIRGLELEATVRIEPLTLLQTNELSLESIAPASRFLNFRMSLAQN
jgi:hypothetical protein